GLAQVAFNHRKLVITGGGIPAYFYIPAKEFRCLFEFFGTDAQVGQLQQSVGILRIGFQRPLEKYLRGGVISLPLLNKTHIEKTGDVARVELQALLEVLFRFVKAAEMSVRQSHEGE